MRGVNPARAGMILVCGGMLIRPARKPRASGDDPPPTDMVSRFDRVNPARAGQLLITPQPSPDHLSLPTITPVIILPDQREPHEHASRLMISSRACAGPAGSRIPAESARPIDAAATNRRAPSTTTSPLDSRTQCPMCSISSRASSAARNTGKTAACASAKHLGDAPPEAFPPLFHSTTAQPPRIPNLTTTYCTQ